MKSFKIVFLSVLILLCFCIAGCENPNSSISQNEGILTVVNATEEDFVHVVWTYENGIEIDLGSDDIFDVPLSANVKGIKAKGECSISLEEGNGTLSFYLAKGGSEMELKEEYSIIKEAETVILITNDTLIKYYK